MRAARLCALVACLCGLVSAAGAAGPVKPVKVLILPVVVNSAATDPTYVSRGISDMLSARLEQLGGVSVLRPDDASPPTARLAEALRAGRQLGGDYVLFGSFTQFGDGASLDMRCVAVKPGSTPGRTIFIQSGTMADIIPKLDDLSDKVARYMRGEAPAETASTRAQKGSEGGVTLEDLQRRLEALERAVFPPVAGATGPEKGKGGEPNAEGAPES